MNCGSRLWTRNKCTGLLQLIQIIALSTIIVYTPTLLCAQARHAKRYKAKLTWTDDSNNSHYFYCYMTELKDRSIMFIDLPSKDMPLQNRISRDVEIRKIEKVKYRRQGSVGKGLLIGATAGTVIGAVIGTATYKEPDCTHIFCGLEQYSARVNATRKGAAIGLAVGGVFGATIGSMSAKFELNGDMKRYQKNKEAMSKYLYHIN